MGQPGLFAAALVGIADHAAGALARVRACFVVADGTGGTGVGRALVDVAASVLDSWPAGEAALAEARRRVVEQHAVRVWSARQVFAGICATTLGSTSS